MRGRELVLCAALAACAPAEPESARSRPLDASPATVTAMLRVASTVEPVFGGYRSGGADAQQHWSGPDGVADTEDDRAFTSVAELEEVLGWRTVEALRDFVQSWRLDANPCPGADDEARALRAFRGWRIRQPASDWIPGTVNFRYTGHSLLVPLRVDADELVLSIVTVVQLRPGPTSYKQRIIWVTPDGEEIQSLDARPLLTFPDGRLLLDVKGESIGLDDGDQEEYTGTLLALYQDRDLVWADPQGRAIFRVDRVFRTAGDTWGALGESLTDAAVHSFRLDHGAVEPSRRCGDAAWLVVPYWYGWELPATDSDLGRALLRWYNTAESNVIPYSWTWLLEWRKGPDGLLHTDDDRYFSSIEELAARDDPARIAGLAQLRAEYGDLENPCLTADEHELAFRAYRGWRRALADPDLAGARYVGPVLVSDDRVVLAVERWRKLSATRSVGVPLLVWTTRDGQELERVQARAQRILPDGTIFAAVAGAISDGKGHQQRVAFPGFLLDASGPRYGDWPVGDQTRPPSESSSGVWPAEIHEIEDGTAGMLAIWRDTASSQSGGWLAVMDLKTGAEVSLEDALPAPVCGGPW